MLTVASIPSAHPYVVSTLPDVAPAPYRSVPTDPPSEAAVARLPDPAPDDGPTRPGVWWPPRWFDIHWAATTLARHRGLVDVVHVHFGFEGRSVEQLEEWTGLLRRHGIPLVVTVHDLQNPHLLDQAHHEATLDVLVRAAERVVTLTDRAAQTIENRWGTMPLVVPHPAIVPLDAIVDRPRTGVVGMYLGSMRAGTDPSPWVGELHERVVASGRRLAILVQPGVDPGPLPVAPRVVPRLPDAELHAWVGGLDLAVLPYRHGTHSGWLEMCWDLGIPVAAPPVGCFAVQHPDPAFVRPVPVVEHARDGASCPWGTARQRRAIRETQVREVRAAHAAVYEQVCS